jgi:hypothetical protein
VNKNDFVECVDCHRHLADPPATVCVWCQMPRFKAMRDLYNGTAAKEIERAAAQQALF